MKRIPTGTYVGPGQYSQFDENNYLTVFIVDASGGMSYDFYDDRGYHKMEIKRKTFNTKDDNKYARSWIKQLKLSPNQPEQMRKVIDAVFNTESISYL